MRLPQPTSPRAREPIVQRPPPKDGDPDHESSGQSGTQSELKHRSDGRCSLGHVIPVACGPLLKIVCLAPSRKTHRQSRQDIQSDEEKEEARDKRANQEYWAFKESPYLSQPSFSPPEIPYSLICSGTEVGACDTTDKRTRSAPNREADWGSIP